MGALAVLLLVLLVGGCVKTKDATGTDTNTTDGGSGGPTTTPPAEPLALTVTTSAPYAFAPTALTAAPGQLVNLTYTNNDPVPIQQHDWVLDEASAQTDVVGVGESASVLFLAPEAGTYTFYCSVGNHRQLGMVGTFTVE